MSSKSNQQIIEESAAALNTSSNKDFDRELREAVPLLTFPLADVTLFRCP